MISPQHIQNRSFPHCCWAAAWKLFSHEQPHMEVILSLTIGVATHTEDTGYSRGKLFYRLAQQALMVDPYLRATLKLLNGPSLEDEFDITDHNMLV